ncbi:MAG: hypothetical protein HY456_01175 [Parcubacteria group bacterium]|nr:hypothetical protein [Parcubacteria group bacterium]
MKIVSKAKEWWLISLIVAIAAANLLFSYYYAGRYHNQSEQVDLESFGGPASLAFAFNRPEGVVMSSAGESERQTNSPDFSVVGDSYVLGASNPLGNVLPARDEPLLPVSGIIHHIQDGEILESVAALYSVSAEMIVKYNKKAKFEEGEDIIIPGAKPLEYSGDYRIQNYAQ